MTTSLLASSALAGQPRIAARWSLTVAAASRSKGVKVCSQTNKESNNGRRDLMSSVAAAISASSVAGIAMADELKPKAYGPVCVTMPATKICHK